MNEESPEGPDNTIPMTMCKFHLPEMGVRIRVITMSQMCSFGSLAADHGLDGFELVGIVHDNVPTELDEVDKVDGYACRRKRTVFVRRALFVLRQTESAALEVADLAKRTAEGQLYEEQKLRRVLQAQNEMHEKRSTALEEQVKDLERWRTNDQKLCLASGEHLRKLEGDLAKVRSAIGDLRWNEIVGGKP